MKCLTAYYQLTGFIVDMEPAPKRKKMPETEEENQQKWYQCLMEDKYKALYHMGFLVRPVWMTPSIAYLHRIAELLIHRISQQSELELMREETSVCLSREDILLLKDEIPFVNGTEFVDEKWIEELWQNLHQVFQREIKEYEGSAAMYFTEYNSNINVASRVFFHLVESREEKYSFAFMATYSTKPVKSKKAVHTPLKNALKEFKDDQKKLLGLMAAVGRAADNSEFISSLMENGELFSPLRLTSQEAYTFLREIPLYEKAGIMCRVPDWWRKRTNALKLNISVGEKSPYVVGMDAIMDFSPVMSVDGENFLRKIS